MNLLEDYANSDILLPLAGSTPVHQQFSVIDNLVRRLTKIPWNKIYNEEVVIGSRRLYSDPKLSESVKDDMLRRLRLSDSFNHHVDAILKSEIDNGTVLTDSISRSQRRQELCDFLVDYYRNYNNTLVPSHNSIHVLRIAYLTVMKVCSRMFPEGIFVNSKEVQLLAQKYMGNPLSIVFLPCHKSHVDYMIMHILCLRCCISIPSVIAGINLNVAIFGRVLSNCGAIFIKRQLVSANQSAYEGSASTEQENIQLLLRGLLVDRQLNLEVFIEGGRARAGKVLLPKLGILKAILKSGCHSDKDLIVQPVSIQYEKVYEFDGYMNELMGTTKVQESALNIVRSGISSSSAKRGKVFVSIASAFLLKEDFLKGSRALYENNDRSLAVSHLGYKVLTEINKCSYIPEVAILSCAVLHAHYKTRQKVLAASDVVSQAKQLVLALCGKQQRCLHLKPLVDLEEHDFYERFQRLNFKHISVGQHITVSDSTELFYYRNMLIHLFVSEAIVSLAALCLETFSQDRISKLCGTLVVLLQKEFLFTDFDVATVLEGFVRSKLLQSEDNSYTVADKRILQEKALFVMPFIEGYWLCVQELSLSPAVNRQEFLKRMHSVDRMFAESTNNQNVLNCLAIMEEEQYVESYTQRRSDKFVKHLKMKKDMQGLLKWLSALCRYEFHEFSLQKSSKAVFRMRVPPNGGVKL